MDLSYRELYMINPQKARGPFASKIILPKESRLIINLVIHDPLESMGAPGYINTERSTHDHNNTRRSIHNGG